MENAVKIGAVPLNGTLHCPLSKGERGVVGGKGEESNCCQRDLAVETEIRG